MTFNKICEPARLKQEIEASAITVALDLIVVSNGVTTVTFKATLSQGEEDILDALVTAHVATPLANDIAVVNINNPKTTTGLIKVAAHEPEGGAATIVSHNFSDKSSWWQGAVQVIKGSMTNVGLVYTCGLEKTHWIDLEHGRQYDEDNIMALSGNAYKVKVYVDDVLVTTGYTVDYELGTVTFDDTPSGVVTVSYWYADKSWIRLRPKVGKVMSVKAAEVQFSKTTTMPKPFVFCPWFVDHPVYGTMEIPGQRIVYKNAKDFISACNEGQGLIPKWGELTEDIHVFPFNYVRPKPIKFTDYIEIRVYCIDDEPVTGEYATATFYVTIDDL